ncbi:dynamin family protein [Bacillus sp. SCS-151]|uniref:dynamin family protein n=1 Tax=Nanhaiella sioensis TaxID=3115293 RepID=UPI0039793618
MGQTGVKKYTTQNITSGLFDIYHKIYDEGDSQTASKIVQLMKKLQSEEFTIGFCGHFSAGKSSMINELIGEQLLPTSPIPTSANLVKVKRGDKYARVYFHSGEVMQYEGPYNYELVKSLCKDGDSVASIELSVETTSIPLGVSIMDTPGIDSTDDAHRLATESALHIADTIFFVMDYNHVQSEENFLFAKELKDRGKEVYLIINQIDKHQEQEVSFFDFANGVKNSFLNWKVEADGIFYTSLKKKDHPLNELASVKKLLQKKINEKDSLLIKTSLLAAEKLLNEHLQYYVNKTLDQQNIFEKTLSHLPVNEREELLSNINNVQQEIDEKQQALESAELNCKKDIQAILDNAYLMPYSTREHARAFIEASQADFKIGLFSSKKKIAKEREDRLDVLCEDIKDKISSQLEWHIKDYFLKFCKKQAILEDELTRDIQTFSITLESSMLENILKKGARLTGDYVLTYTNDVVQMIKRMCRDETNEIINKIIFELNKHTSTQIDMLQNILKQQNNLMDAKSGLDQLVSMEERHRKSLNNLLHRQNELPQDNEELKALLEEHIVFTSMEDANQDNEVTDSQVIHSSLDNTNLTLRNNRNQGGRVNETIKYLNHVCNQISATPGFATVVKELREKSERLENRNFTVALFGAFSAGKSSFANALLGDKVLPVSPNPTTATINKIIPPSDEFPHGTVKVKLKTQQQIFEDVQQSLKIFNLKASTLEDAIKLLKQGTYRQQVIDSRDQSHYSFLHAVCSGYATMSKNLGSIITTSLATFSDYVSVEEKACFVEWIELAFDSELTRQGISLVDTPGADSVNARHTDVAFDYIKNADAILFVTYYNHAFSKADREFIIQLGRVKDTFSMDKMFFVVNASDLAHSEEELGSVMNFVDEQLVSYGIRDPRLYPISSHKALTAKQNDSNDADVEMGDYSGILRFERDFKTFIIEELAEITISSAYTDIEKVNNMLDDYIKTATTSNDEKNSKLLAATDERESIRSIISTYQIDSQKRSIDQEITELVYYIQQRNFLRFSDLFKESFNPSTLREDGKNIQVKLEGALEELLSAISFDLEQEIRATSLRVEAFLRKQVAEILEDINIRIVGINDHLQFNINSEFEFPTPAFHYPFIGDQVNKNKVIGMYKNARTFFEKNGIQKMSDEIVKQLEEPIHSFLKAMKTQVTSHYQYNFEQYVQASLQKLLNENEDYYEGIILALSDNVDVSLLQEIRQSIVSYMDI